VDYSQDVHPGRMGTIDNQNPLEAGHPKYTEQVESQILDSAAPSHAGLCGDKSERVMSGDEKPVAELRTGFGPVVKAAIV
jgi:hypothetical protein